MIEIKNLTKIYLTPKNEKVKALDKVNFSIERGEYLAITGSSGSGKSTLFSMIAGTDVPTSGQVLVDGINLRRLSPGKQTQIRRQKMGVIYQTNSLLPNLTVEENIILPLVLDGHPPEYTAVEEMLELIQLKERRGELASQLSVGENQRAAIGRILLQRPDILLADEPTGNLNVEDTEEVLRLLKRTNETYGQTIMVVTQDPLVAGAASRQLALHSGKLMDLPLTEVQPKK